MREKIIAAIIILSAACVLNVSASIIEPYIISEYENVTVYSPVSKERYVHAQMAGKYAAMLAKQLGYSEKIVLAFDYYHPEFYGINQRFMIGYTDIKWDWETKTTDKKPVLKISQSAYRVDIVDVLKLLEYAIIRRDEVAAKQKHVVLERWYRESVKTHTLSDPFIASLLTRPPSKIVKKVLANRMYRNDFQEKLFCSLSYYVENGKFHVYFWDGLSTDPYIDIQEFDHVFLFIPVRYSEYVGTNRVILFDTPNTFRYLDGRSKKVSSLHSIGDYNTIEHQCHVWELGKELIAIVLKRKSMIYSNDMTMLYIVPRDLLIFNLEEMFGVYTD